MLRPGLRTAVDLRRRQPGRLATRRALAADPTKREARATQSDYRIRKARPEDTGCLPEIERAAAALFASAGELLGDSEPGDAAWFERARREDLLWVAVDPADQPVGFALFEAFPESLHLEEIDVHPEHGRRGLGRRLLQTAAEEARRRGHRRITLTTFRHVPWNAPYYERLGFRELPRDRLDAALRARVRDEADEGLDPERRVVMEWWLDDGAP